MKVIIDEIVFHVLTLYTEVLSFELHVINSFILGKRN